jgi:hypothetical protein
MKIFFTKILLILFIFMVSKEISAKVLQQDSLALVALYDSTGGQNWTKNNHNWVQYGKPLSQWWGVTITGDRVTGVNVEGFGLRGIIPIQMANLTALQNLNLAKNKLNGNILPELSQLEELESLILSSNELSGVLPAEFGDMEKLKTLNLYFNFIEGTIPKEFGNISTLTYLNLCDNKLTGSIPSELGNLSVLEYLFLNNDRAGRNVFSGTLPPELGNLSSLKELNLSWNQISGNLPKELGALTDLSILDLHFNKLSGEIPIEYGNLINLTSFNVGMNELSGELPLEIGDLKNLLFLDLEQNELSGNLPKEIGRLNKLKTLNLSGNEFSGIVTDSLRNLINLKYVHLNNNQFDGLPDFSSAFANVSYFLVGYNRLTFGDLEKNVGINYFQYMPQDSVGSPVDTLLSEGGSYVMSISVDGDSNLYQWHKNGEVIEGADSCVLKIDSLSIDDSGSYVCYITNTIAVKLTLYSYAIDIDVKSSTAIRDDSSLDLPNTYSLQQNYPNPFNPATKIDFSLPRSEKVTIIVYDLLGQRITTLLNSIKSAGYHSVVFDASTFSAGLYFYSIRAGNYYQIKKMLLVK